MKKQNLNLMAVSLEDFDTKSLRRAAREGRLFIALPDDEPKSAAIFWQEKVRHNPTHTIPAWGDTSLNSVRYGFCTESWTKTKNKPRTSVYQNLMQYLCAERSLQKKLLIKKF